MAHIVCVAGARPNFMKISPILRAFALYPGLQTTLVHTGQHYDDKLSQIFFDELQIPLPDINLGVGSAPRTEQLETIRAAFQPVVNRNRPDLVLVVGDVNSTLACAQVAHSSGILVAHVEAGLRSFDMEMIEEHNRIETDKISDFLFVTEQAGIENLKREQIRGEVHFVGNVMIDCLSGNRDRAAASSILKRLELEGESFIATTFHRPSNVDQKQSLSLLLDTLEQVGRRTKIVFPLHPRTKHSLSNHGLLERLEAIHGIVICEPLGYLDFINLIAHAKAVITDSGGIQEETTYLKVPCITMRENTERPVTISVGSNVLVGSNFGAVMSALDEVESGRFKEGRIPDLWDGHAAERIAAILFRALSTRTPSEESAEAA